MAEKPLLFGKDFSLSAGELFSRFERVESMAFILQVKPIKEAMKGLI